MVGILILILKVIGIVLATIIGILLLLLLLVLFLPIKYKLEGEIENSINSLSLAGTCKWLFGLIKISIQLEGTTFQWDGRVLWFHLRNLFSSDDMEEEDITDYSDFDEITSDELTTDTITLDDTAIDDMPIDDHSTDTELLEKHENTYKSENIDKSENAHNSDTTQKDTRNKKSAKKKASKEKSRKHKSKGKFNISQTINRICDRIKTIKDKKDKVMEFFYIDIHQYTLSKLKKQGLYLLKQIKPKVFRLDAHIGFNDPSITGQFLGIMGILYPIYKDSIHIQPEFEETVYQGELKVLGSLQIYPFIWVLIRMILDKKVRQTYNNIKNFQL